MRGQFIAVESCLNNSSAPAYQLDHQHDERDYEQDVNESAQGIRRNNSQQPQHEQDYKNCPEHCTPPDVCFQNNASISNTQPLTPPCSHGLFAAHISCVGLSRYSGDRKHQCETLARCNRHVVPCISKPRMSNSIARFALRPTSSRRSEIWHHSSRLMRPRILIAAAPRRVKCC